MLTFSFARTYVIAITLGLAISPLRAADFSVTSPGFFFDVNGQQPNPTLILTRGQTYTFDVSTDSIHPFQISANFGGAAYNDGVDNNNIFSGTITFTVPMDAPDTLAYVCTFHFFAGTINIINSAPPADFTVTSPDFFYRINGQEPNPTLTLTRGSNYTFGINTAADHPFQISSDFDGTPYSDGVTGNNISSGLLTFAVPTNAPATLYYICSLHLFGGQINIVAPPPPPPPDFSVTSPGSYYSINGEESPVLTLTRGVTYTFGIETDPSHPFEIATDLGGTPYNDGVVNNNINSGTLTFAVPLNAPDILFYICSIHLFGGMINIVDAPEPPPLVRILAIDVDTSNVVMKSLGTNGNGWLAIPEFSSNLVVSNWAVVPSYSNSFFAGTNTTTFNRLDPICGPNVFLRIKNVKN